MLRLVVTVVLLLLPLLFFDCSDDVVEVGLRQSDVPHGSEVNRRTTADWVLCEVGDNIAGRATEQGQ